MKQAVLKQPLEKKEYREISDKPKVPKVKDTQANYLLTLLLLWSRYFLRKILSGSIREQAVQGGFIALKVVTDEAQCMPAFWNICCMLR